MTTLGAERETHVDVFVSFTRWQPHCVSQSKAFAYPSQRAVTCHVCEYPEQWQESQQFHT